MSPEQFTLSEAVAAAIEKILSEERQHFLMLSGLLKRLQCRPAQLACW